MPSRFVQHSITKQTGKRTKMKHSPPPKKNYGLVEGFHCCLKEFLIVSHLQCWGNSFPDVKRYLEQLRNNMSYPISVHSTPRSPVPNDLHKVKFVYLCHDVWRKAYQSPVMNRLKQFIHEISHSDRRTAGYGFHCQIETSPNQIAQPTNRVSCKIHTIPHCQRAE